MESLLGARHTYFSQQSQDLCPFGIFIDEEIEAESFNKLVILLVNGTPGVRA